MPAPLHTDPIPFITLPNWAKAAAECGIGLEAVLRQLRIDVDLLHLESASLRRIDFERLMEVCVARSRRRHFPLVLGENFGFEYLPELETFLTTSPNLREALRVLDWLPMLVDPNLRLQRSEDARMARLFIDWPQASAPITFQWFVETTFVAVARFARMLLRDRGDLARVCFQFERPEYAEQVERALQMPLHYAQPHNALELDRKLLDLPLESAFPALHQQAEERVNRRLISRGQVAGSTQALADLLEREPQLLGQGVAAVAARMGLHPRSLQRRLRAEGMGFAGVQSQVRANLARIWLRDGRLPLDQIADRLGFSDRRSFSRAFQQWTGRSPSRYRAEIDHA
ncbi:MAG: AraC family transcriptional regulator ligand-binding domain-containing protein [Panacagrimonas sp.]